MSQDKEIYKEYMRKCEPLADKKYRKLAAVSGTHLCNPSKPQDGGGGANISSAVQQASELEKATKAKAALRRDVDDNTKSCDMLNELLNELRGRVDDIELAQKRMTQAMEVMADQCKTDQQMNTDRFTQMAADNNAKFDSAQSARLRIEEQIMTKIMASERAITIARGEAMASAAKERKAMSAETEAIKTSVEELKAEVASNEVRRDAKFHCFAAQNTYDIGLVREAIPEEVGELSRYVDRTKDNLEQQLKDLQEHVFMKNAEFERGRKEESCKVKQQQDELLESVRNNDEKQSRDLEAKANFVLDRLAQERTKLENTFRDERKWTEHRIDEGKKSVDQVRDELKQEVAARTQDRDAILDELARSCMQREKDESGIITAIEGVVKQINHMNQAEAH